MPATPAAARTITLRTHAGAHARNRIPAAVHALAHELPGVAVGTVCGRTFGIATTAGLTIDAEPRPITCTACREQRPHYIAEQADRAVARRRPEQLAMTLGMLAERPGSQLDLIAEAGVETVGPSTVTTAAHAAGRLF